MKRVVLTTAMLAATGCAAQTLTRSAPLAADLALLGVAVVDVEAGRVLRDRIVLIRANRIVHVAPTRSVRLDGQPRLIDARGLYVIPGLWDMHVHVMYRGGYDVFGPLFLANGITGIRDMGNSPMTQAELRLLRAAVLSGERIGPRFIAAGPLIDGPNSFWQLALRAGSPERGRFIVDSLRSEGAEFLKVYSDLPAATYGAIMARAGELGVPVVGHVPSGVVIAEAARQGQRSMEHLLGFLEACAADEHALAAERARLREARARGDTTLDFETVNRRVFEVYVHDERRCAALLGTLAAADTWQVPTLALHRAAAFPLDSAARHDPRLRFLPTWLRSWWRDPADTSAAAWETRRRRYEHDEHLVRSMHRSGVPLLAGSDAPNRYVFPAFGLHDEMDALVGAGLEPQAALRAATIQPARFLGADTLGMVREGNVADLVLLRANPLADIRNAREIAGVVFNGRYFDREELDRMIEGAAGATR